MKKKYDNPLHKSIKKPTKQSNKNVLQIAERMILFFVYIMLNKASCFLILTARNLHNTADPNNKRIPNCSLSVNWLWNNVIKTTTHEVFSVSLLRVLFACTRCLLKYIKNHRSSCIFLFGAKLNSGAKRGKKESNWSSY